ncbi:MAG: NHLP bacteriocin system secretion protein [Acidobacteriota bacterium]
MPRSGPFRQRSVERLSSPERLDEMMRVAHPVTWLPLLGLGALVVGALVWSVVGSVPSRVSGQSVLVRPRQVVSVQSPTSGRLGELGASVGDLVEEGQLIGRVDQADAAQALEQVRADLRRLRSRQAERQRLTRGRRALERESVQAQRERLEEQSSELRQLSDQARQLERQRWRDRRDDLRTRLAAARALTAERQERRKRLAALVADGLESEATLLDLEQRLFDAKEAEARLEADLQAAERSLLQADETRAREERELASMESELSELRLRERRLAEETLDETESLETRIVELESERDRLKLQLETEGRVRAPTAGRVLELHAQVGNVLSAGQSLGSVEIEEAEAPLLALAYFPVGDGKRLAPGMPVQLSPDAVARQRHGSLKGTVRAISPLPVSLPEIERRVGHRGLAEQLTGGQAVLQVEIELALDEDGDLAWTSSKGPKRHPMSAGQTGEARVEVQRRRPLSFVLPILREREGAS